MPVEPPPTKSEAELLAGVYERARGIRRQRLTRAITGGSVALMLVAAGVAVVAGRGITTRKVNVAGQPSPDMKTGLHVEVVANESKVPTATVVHFAVRVRDDSGGISRIAFDYGDGTDALTTLTSPVCNTASDVAAPSDETIRYDHGYRTPGVYRARAIVISTGGTCDAPAQETEEGVRTVDVTPGAQQSNGPLAPSASVYEWWPQDRDPTLAYVHLRGDDQDGYISRLTVDWGDGSKPESFDYALADCNDRNGTTWSQYNYSERDAPHHYAPGRYRVVLTATSVGCDGNGAQTANAETQVLYPSVPPSS